jgi:hypothetical protein
MDIGTDRCYSRELEPPEVDWLEGFFDARRRRQWDILEFEFPKSSSIVVPLGMRSSERSAKDKCPHWLAALHLDGGLRSLEINVSNGGLRPTLE